jgi:rhodanese-related sulfurtransferase
MKHFSAPELAQEIGVAAQPGAAHSRLILLDVREPWEIEIASLPESKNIPMGEITQRFEEISREQTVVCICHHGVRSLQVGMFLERQGFENIVNLTGGIDAWSKLVDTSCPSY